MTNASRKAFVWCKPKAVMFMCQLTAANPLRMRSLFFFACGLVCSGGVAQMMPITLNQPDDGYRGIWYFIGPLKTEYAYKYSGGLATYPANHHPFAVYAPAVQKTFFCYGGASKDTNGTALRNPGPPVRAFRDTAGPPVRFRPSLLHEVGYFDHRTGQVSRPTIVLDKGTDDAHDNPVLNIDGQGYLWLFSTSYGTDRPSLIHRSRQPYDITAFDRVMATRSSGDSTVPFDNFSYLQSHYQPGRGFLHLMTHYERGMLKYGVAKARRTIGYLTSPDGIRWSPLRDIAVIEEGHYQTSHQQGANVGTAFNLHPDTQQGAGLNYRTNLYYVETTDFGQTWQTADGKPAALPLREPQNSALVKDYRSLGFNVYISDVAHDRQGRPVIHSVYHQQRPRPRPGQWSLHLARGSLDGQGLGDLHRDDLRP